MLYKYRSALDLSTIFTCAPAETKPFGPRRNRTVRWRTAVEPKFVNGHRQVNRFFTVKRKSRSRGQRTTRNVHVPLTGAGSTPLLPVRVERGCEHEIWRSAQAEGSPA